MLKVWNMNVITLVPKKEHAEGLGHYRPITCCDTIYKVISKVLCNRLGLILPTIFFDNQSVVVTGKQLLKMSSSVNSWCGDTTGRTLKKAA
uniref:Putative ovule protein n=1 Tax=Solanum chacoense TaxID=4108 RepID=A0A0V0GV53_SOLCH